MTAGGVGRVNGLFIPVLTPLLDKEVEGRLEWTGLQTRTQNGGSSATETLIPATVLVSISSSAQSPTNTTQTKTGIQFRRGVFLNRTSVQGSL